MVGSSAVRTASAVVDVETEQSQQPWLCPIHLKGTSGSRTFHSTAQMIMNWPYLLLEQTPLSVRHPCSMFQRLRHLFSWRITHVRGRYTWTTSCTFSVYYAMNPDEATRISNVQISKPRKWAKITKLLQLYKLHLAPSGSKLEKMTDAQDKELTVSAIGDTFRQIIGHMKVGGWVCKSCKLCNAT